MDNDGIFIQLIIIQNKNEITAICNFMDNFSRHNVALESPTHKNTNQINGNRSQNGGSFLPREE